jgi:hypothetical protein
MEYHLLICYSFKALLDGVLMPKPVRPASFIGRVNCWTPDNEYRQKRLNR